MCTLYWEQNPQAFRLLFNRDEQRSRTISDFLKVHDDLEGSGPLIYSRDPDGGGTWLGSAVESGLVVALLNNYPEGVKPLQGKRSRGLLVKDLLRFSSLIEIKTALEGNSRWPLSDYGSFHLLVFNLNNILSLSWDGHTLKEIPRDTSTFITTSSVDPQRIIPLRKAACAKARINGFSRVRNLFLTPTHTAEGICMDREDARTVSFTEINLSPQKLIHTFRHREARGNGFEVPIEVTINR